MKKISPLIYALMIGGIIYFGNTSIKVGGSALPPLMKFGNPFSGFWHTAATADGLDSKTLDFDGLQKEVNVVFDDRLVPHIFADHLEDALMAQGYIHAKYRLFQMDISTRSIGGRLSEIMGPDLQARDRMQRYLGIRHSAEKSVEAWKKYPELFRLLEKYVSGVNQYIDHLNPEDYPLEFKLLDYAPERWSIMKSALFFKNMTRMLAGHYNDLGNTNMLKILGQEKFDELYPDWNPKQSPIIPTRYSEPGNEITQADIPEFDRYFEDAAFEKYPPTIGSNNWAVNGSKTQSGNPILCSDPHLGLTLPSIWYEMHIHTPESNSYGVSLPSMPGVIIGFNQDIAWGVTNVGHDLWDWYEMDWVDDAQTKYKYNGSIKEVTYVEETIKIKGAPDITDQVKYTVHGPVIPDYSPRKATHGMSFKWISNIEPDRSELNTFLELNQAKDYNGFRKALENYVAPAQNFVFADGKGDIALHVNGQFPKRQQNGGKFIKDGSVTDPDWLEFVPRDEVPQIHNPARNFVSSANQHSTYPDYPYYYSGGFEDYRSRRINGRLTEMDHIEISDMQKLQMDNVSVKSQDALPIMLANTSENNANKTALSTLTKWNHSYDFDAIAPSYFEKWFDEIYELTFDEIIPLRDSMSIRYPEEWKLIEMMDTDPENEYFDIKSTTNKKEVAEDIINQALDSLLAKMDSKPDSDDWSWSTYQKRNINHLTQIPAFSVRNIKSSGTGDTPNANWGGHGPSWRMVIDVDPDGIKGYGVYPGGQDGNPASKYARTGIDHWTTGKYFDLFFPKSLEEAKKKELYHLSIK